MCILQAQATEQTTALLLAPPGDIAKTQLVEHPLDSQPTEQPIHETAESEPVELGVSRRRRKLLCTHQSANNTQDTTQE